MRVTWMLVPAVVVLGCDPAGSPNPSTSGSTGGPVGPMPGMGSTAWAGSDAGTSGGEPDGTSGGPSSTESSTGAPPETTSSSGGGAEPPLPIEWPADWASPLGDIDGSAIVIADDGTILVGGRLQDTAIVYALSPQGELLWTYSVDPLSWDDGLVPEGVQDLAVLDDARLAVLVSRGSIDDERTHDGTLSLDLETQESTWSALTLTPTDGPFGLDPHSHAAKRLVATQGGELFVEGEGWSEPNGAVPTIGPPGTYLWVERLDPSSGVRAWSHTLSIGEYGEPPTVTRVLRNHDAQGRLLIQSTYTSGPSGACGWREIDRDTGDYLISDFTLGTHLEACLPVQFLSDGTAIAAAGFYADANFDHLHAAGPDGLAEYPLDATDAARVRSLHVGTDDSLFVTAALQEPWVDAGIPWGLARLTLEPSPSTEVLMTWSDEALFDEVVAIAFGPLDSLVMLRRGPSGTIVERRTVPTTRR
jgi:hypothetical protein